MMSGVSDETEVGSLPEFELRGGAGDEFAVDDAPDLEPFDWALPKEDLGVKSLLLLLVLPPLLFLLLLFLLVKTPDAKDGVVPPVEETFFEDMIFY